MFGAEVSEFPVFLCQHIIMIKQLILGLLVGLIWHYIIVGSIGS